MERKITIGKDTFTYENNGHYIRITHYSYEDGTLIFTEEEDGSCYFHIHIPETIDGLPVLVVDRLWVNVDYYGHYRHNGLDVVKMHLPENTAYWGLGDVRKDKYSVFVPYNTTEYYPREKQLLITDEGTYRFYGERRNDHTCQIILMTTTRNYLKKDWVWDKAAPDLSPLEKLVVPSQIGEYTVSEICTDSTYYTLRDETADKIKEVHIEEGIEVIGDSCFSGLPSLTNVYLPKSLKYIGKEAFSFYRCSQYIYANSVPTLVVHYYNAMPTVGEDAFHRHAVEEEYEDYADWGLMHVRDIRHDYEVVYQKNQ